MEELNDIAKYEKEWRKSKPSIQKKLKYSFIFFQNLSGIFLILAMFIYWSMQSHSFFLFVARVRFLADWLLHFLFY